MKINGSNRIINSRQILFYHGKTNDWYVVECATNESQEPCVIVIRVRDQQRAVHPCTLLTLMRDNPTFVRYNWGDNRVRVEKEEIERIYHGVEV